MLFACTPFCYTPGTARELTVHTVYPGHTRDARNPETHTLGDDGTYIYIYIYTYTYTRCRVEKGETAAGSRRDIRRERERGRIVGREAIDFFLSPSDESTAAPGGAGEGWCVAQKQTM